MAWIAAQDHPETLQFSTHVQYYSAPKPTERHSWVLLGKLWLKFSLPWEHSVLENQGQGDASWVLFDEYE